MEWHCTVVLTVVRRGRRRSMLIFRRRRSCISGRRISTIPSRPNLSLSLGSSSRTHSEWRSRRRPACYWLLTAYVHRVHCEPTHSPRKPVPRSHADTTFLPQCLPSWRLPLSPCYARALSVPLLLDTARLPFQIDQLRTENTQLQSAALERGYQGQKKLSGSAVPPSE